MRVLIVDDEPLSRTALVNVVSKRADLRGFDVAQDAYEAIEYLRTQTYDVLLLDIQMPELSGLELAERLRKQKKPVPAVIFVTAHHQYAVAAFEQKAIDYVLKPFVPERVHEALDSAMQRSADERAARQLEMLGSLSLLFKQSPRIALKVKGRILFVDPVELVAAEANGNYVLLHQKSGSYLLRDSLSDLADKLSPYGFVRIHRSVMVNSSFVEAIEPFAPGEYLLRMKTGKTYTVTRTYKNNLKSLAQFWIGTDVFGEETKLPVPGRAKSTKAGGHGN